MDMKLFMRGALPAATLLAALVASPVQASYICTGVSGNAAGNPFFDSDLTDERCDVTEVETALGGITIDTNLIRKSKTNSTEDVDGNLDGWGQDEFGLGTLDVTSFDNFSGTWELTGNVEPLFFVVKYDGGYDAYTYMGGDTSPFIDSWDDSNRGDFGADCGELNCNAATSHLSVYGVVPVPAAVWLFGSGLLGLVGIARRKRS